MALASVSKHSLCEGTTRGLRAVAGWAVARVATMIGGIEQMERKTSDSIEYRTIQGEAGVQIVMLQALVEY